MGRKRKPAIEKLRDAAVIKPERNPWDLVEPLHIDEIKILFRIVCYMHKTHLDTTEQETRYLIDEITFSLSNSFSEVGKCGAKPLPRRAVVDAARFLVEEMGKRSIFMTQGTIFHKD
ncbi:hypothetical protein [Gluconobacter albidus]|uniref:Uncharacterized protein n=1 Tax=Gluconobacter albidus TaxID=318683 RepID=A0ABQ5X3K5_9PROT|nr:hypothetical protein [Gluconobacter albidus]GBQ90924.1 hypothetical protein AA3250_2171 [Gluconobacter albidus NBRC 3250]GLQ69359.1 hypothetical protein GCM10007866_18100 [Gluconobacter albidus]